MSKQRGYRAWFELFVLLSVVALADFRRLRSVDRTVDGNNPLLNSVEFIWGTTTVAVGDTAVLHCSFDAIFQQLRTGSIDWVKEETVKSDDETVDELSPSGVVESSRTFAVKIASGKQVAIDDRRYRVYRPHNSALSVLIIRRSRRQDAGIYRCNLSGSSTRHKYMILNVTESKIEAQTSPAKTVAKVGTDVTLWCNASGYPKPVVYWTREDRSRKLPDGNQQFWGNELHFEKVTEADTGIYTCYLDNFVQPVVSYKFSLMVEDNPWNVEGSKMRFDSSQWYRWDSPEPRPVRHKSYLLLCETRGSPKPLPTIQWYRDGRPLRNSKHFYIIEDSPEWRSSYTSSTLVIMRFMTEFQGNYTCVASNAFRMKKQTFYLSDILSAPEDKASPSGPLPQPGRALGVPRPGGRPFVNNIPPPSTEEDSVSSHPRISTRGRGRGEERTNVRQAAEVRNKMAAVDEQTNVRQAVEVRNKMAVVDERPNVRQVAEVRNKMAAVVRNVTRNAVSQRQGLSMTSQAGSRTQSSTSLAEVVAPVAGTGNYGSNLPAVTPVPTGSEYETKTGGRSEQHLVGTDDDDDDRDLSDDYD